MKSLMRITAVLLAAMIGFLTTPTALAVDREGFLEKGDYSSGEVAFKFESADAALTYNGKTLWSGSDLDYDNIYPGSKLYFPIYCYDTTGEEAYKGISDTSRISANDVRVSYKANVDRMIAGVSIIDSGSADTTLPESGAYVCVEFAETQADPLGTYLSLQLILSVNRITEQGTSTTLYTIVRNRTEEIKRNSIYSAQLPTAFESDRYTGEATFDFGGNVKYTATVEKGGYYYMTLNRDSIREIEDSSSKTHMEFYTFEGEDYGKTFPSGGRIQLPVSIEAFREKKDSDPQIYVYEINGNDLRALDESDISFQRSSGVLTIHTNMPRSYVLSAKPLLKTIESEQSILHTGYAVDENDEPVSTSSGGTNTSGSSSGEIAMPDIPPVPIEPSIETENPVGGGDSLYAANSSTHNPSTSDTAPFYPLIAVMIICLAVLPSLYKKAFLG